MFSFLLPICLELPVTGVTSECSGRSKLTELVEKVVQSAAANAENNHDMNPDALYVAEISANQGPTMKRWRPGAQGRAGMILKRTSHIYVTLKEREVAAKQAPKAEEPKEEKSEKEEVR